MPPSGDEAAEAAKDSATSKPTKVSRKRVGSGIDKVVAGAAPVHQSKLGIKRNNRNDGGSGDGPTESDSPAEPAAKRPKQVCAAAPQPHLTILLSYLLSILFFILTLAPTVARDASVTGAATSSTVDL